MLEPDPGNTTPSATENRDRRSDDVRAPMGFLEVDRQGNETVDGDPAPDPASRGGDDLACWASLVCLGCGGVTTDPAHDVLHRRWLAALEEWPIGG